MLWYVGSIYVIVLLLILIIGLGIVGTRLLAASADSLQGLLAGKKLRAGGGAKQQMPWLNYAAAAFAGIIITYFALGLSAVNNGDATAHNHGGNGNQGFVQAVNHSGNWPAGQGYPIQNTQQGYLGTHLGAMQAQNYYGYYGYNGY